MYSHHVTHSFCKYLVSIYPYLIFNNEQVFTKQLQVNMTSSTKELNNDWNVQSTKIEKWFIKHFNLILSIAILVLHYTLNHIQILKQNISENNIYFLTDVNEIHN